MVDAGIDANVQSYSTVVDAFTRAGNAAGAEHWFENMHDAAVKGDNISSETALLLQKSLRNLKSICTCKQSLKTNNARN